MSNHNKKNHKRNLRLRKSKEKRKAQRASQTLAENSVVETVESNVFTLNAKRYEKVFNEEVLPYSEYLSKYGVKEVRTAVRVTDNPADPFNFISKREIAIRDKEKNEGEEYLEIPPRPAKMNKESVLKFLGERGLSHFVSFEKADEAMSSLYGKLATSYGTDVAEGFFEQHGRYLVEMRYDEEAGWYLPTNKAGHFDLIRKPDFDYRKYITKNYREVNIQWQSKD